MVQNPLLRFFLFSVGVLATLLGLIGIVVPLLPTVPFILLAAWCFVKSSERTYRLLRSQKHFDRALTDWEQHRRIRRPVKVLAISMIIASAIFLSFRVEHLHIKGPVLIFLFAVSLFIATRNEKPRNGNSNSSDQDRAGF